MSTSESWAKTTNGGIEDWYSDLGLTMSATEEEIDRAIERRSRQASVLATTAPERSQQMRDTLRAIRGDILSGPENRRLYDERLAAWRQEASASSALTAAPPPPAASATNQPKPTEAAGAIVINIPPIASRFRRFLQTGWTCPACEAEGGPGDRFCGVCGAPMKPEQPAVAPTLAETPAPVCTNCASALAREDRFCDQCGTPVTRPEQG